MSHATAGASRLQPHPLSARMALLPPLPHAPMSLPLRSRRLAPPRENVQSRDVVRSSERSRWHCCGHERRRQQDHLGYPMHGGPNQQWDFIPFGLGYAIRCMRPATDGNVLYLTVDSDCGGVRDRTPIVAGTHPVAWNVQQTEEGIIISWPNSNYVFDLSNWGDKTAGTKIQLMPLLPGELCQIWRLDARGPAPEVCNTTVAVSSVETFTVGTSHVLLNAHGETAVDVSGALNTSIVGSAMHGGDSQQWEFVKFGLGYSIRCARASAEGHALYLTLDGSGPRDCAPVVAGTHPVAWNVEQVEAGMRISWANSKYVFHQAKEEDQAVCNKIQLMPLVPGELCQLWRATQVTAACK